LAKAKGKYKGGTPKYRENDPRLQLAFNLFLTGSTDKEVEELTGINRRTFRRYRMKHGITNEVREQKNKSFS
ncbi:TPA: recombinase family protein, partial [Salmonella enterica]|nr:recombinase family protein [Salmonella enterica]